MKSFRDALQRGAAATGGFSAVVTVRSLSSALAILLALVVDLPALSGSQSPRNPTEGISSDSTDFELIERLAAETVRRIEAEHGAESLEAARSLDLFVGALIRNGKAATANALAVCERALRLKERHLGVSHPEVAVSLHNLGTVRTERGEFDDAVALHRRALLIRRATLSFDAPELADSLDDLAVPLIYQERFREAQLALDESRRIREGQSAASPLGLAHTLRLLALLQRYDGRYAEAIDALDRALDIHRRLSPDDAELPLVMQLSGDLLFLTGDPSGAQKAWLEAQALAIRILGSEHPAIVTIRQRLAISAKSFGDRTEEKRLLEEALRVGERALVTCSPGFPSVLHHLALSVLDDGDYARAQALFERARSAHEQCLGPNNTETATVIHNQAYFATQMGDLTSAQKLEQRAIQIWTKTLSAEHPHVAWGLDALAEVLALQGASTRSRALYERALGIRQRAFGSEHPDVAWTLVNLARTSLQSGDLNRASDYLTKAIGIYRRLGVADNTNNFAIALPLMAEVESRRGDYERARSTLDETLATRTRLFGDSHPLVAETRAQIAALELRVGLDEDALANALDAERIGREHLTTTIRYLPERQALAYATSRPKGLDLALSIAVASEASNPVATLDSVIRSRSIVLDELAARAHASLASDPIVANLMVVLVASRQRYANLMLRSVSDLSSVPISMLEDARRQKENAERALAEKSVAFRDELARGEIGLADVRNALPANAALVAFVRYDRTTSFGAATAGAATVTNRQPSRNVRPTPSYVAFIVRADAERPSVVPLGPAATVDTLVGNWRTETTRAPGSASAAAAEQSYRAAGGALRRRIWDPLRAYLTGATKIFVVPDGALNVVSLAALPVDDTRYLIESEPLIHYLSAERDLVPDPSRTPLGNGLLAVGGAAFDDTSSFTPARGSSASTVSKPTASRPPVMNTQRRAPCGSFESLRFNVLPGTRQEVSEIARSWTGSAADVLQDRAASETAFKRQAPGHRVLHIATHGFFLGDCSSISAETRSVGGLTTGQRSLPDGLRESPLLLSGLALAGANRRSTARPGDDDGILTAEEVSALNLSGVEWAVLSACDTGLGVVKASEGVFGLRRAFQTAGVRTVIMSLWPVDDQAAKSWMLALYAGRFQHLTTAEAVQQASLRMLRTRRAGKQTTHPFYWAAFVAVGDWQ